MSEFVAKKMIIPACLVAVAVVSNCKNPSRGSDGKKLAESPAGMTLTGDGANWFCNAKCISGDSEFPTVDDLMEQNTNPEVAYAKMAKQCIDREGALGIKRTSEAEYSPALIGDVCQRGGREQSQVCAGVCQSTFKGGQNSYRFVRTQSSFEGEKKLANMCKETESILLEGTFSCLPSNSSAWTCTYPCKGEGEDSWERVFIRSGPTIESAFGQLTADCALDSGVLNLSGVSLSDPYHIDSLCVAAQPK